MNPAVAGKSFSVASNLATVSLLLTLVYFSPRVSQVGLSFLQLHTKFSSVPLLDNIKPKRKGGNSLATPGSVKFNKEILGGVVDNGVVLVGNKDKDGLILNGGDLLTLDGRGELSSNKVVYEGVDGLEVDLLGLVERELGHGRDVLNRE